MSLNKELLHSLFIHSFPSAPSVPGLLWVLRQRLAQDTLGSRAPDALLKMHVASKMWSLEVSF